MGDWCWSRVSLLWNCQSVLESLVINLWKKVADSATFFCLMNFLLYPAMSIAEFLLVGYE